MIAWKRDWTAFYLARTFLRAKSTEIPDMERVLLVLFLLAFSGLEVLMLILLGEHWLLHLELK